MFLGTSIDYPQVITNVLIFKAINEDYTAVIIRKLNPLYPNVVNYFIYLQNICFRPVIKGFFQVSKCVHVYDIYK